MNSVIQICNTALSHFGGGQINSLDEASEAARMCNLKYENCRDVVLRDFPWPFARKIEYLALTDTKIPGWTYVYQIPASCLRARRVFNDNDEIGAESPFEKPKHPFEIYEDKLVCHVETAYLEFTIKITDPTKFDVKFMEALSYKLASELVIVLLGNTQRKQEFVVQYQQALIEAKTVAMKERYKKRQYQSSWIEGR